MTIFSAYKSIAKRTSGPAGGPLCCAADCPGRASPQIVLILFTVSAILCLKGVRQMLPYTIDEIRRRITPVAQKYGLAAVYLFGSYARGEATAESDVDLLVDITGTAIDSLFKLGGLYSELEAALETTIDLVTLDSMEEPTDRRSQLHFREAVKRERMMIYAAA